MATRDDLAEWVEEALRSLGGSAFPIDVAKEVWRAHEDDLRASGDLFYTWQYDIRWAATRLRQSGFLDFNERGEPWKLRE